MGAHRAKNIAFLPLSLLFGIAPASFAAEPSLAELWAIVEQQQVQITALSEELAATRSTITTTADKVAVTEEQLSITADYLERVAETTPRQRTQIGGYGELHYNNIDADDASGDLEQIDLHRFVTFISHEFSDRIRFFSEVEIEHSLVKDTADGSNDGEVEIEQAYIEFDLNDNHYVKTGLFLVPVGILNETHEPPSFYGVERNNVENIIIPSTWWEAGAGVGGHYANGVSWDFAVHSGLEMPVSGANSYRVRSGRQKVSNANANDLAYTLRLKYTGVPGLELAGSYHYQSDPSQTSGDGLDDGSLLSLHAVLQRGGFSLRALWSQWNFDGSAVSLAGSDEQTGWYIEPSFRLNRGASDWGFYTRYEDLDGARTRDQFDQWELGVNYWPTDNVVLKFDYRERDHARSAENGRDFSAFDLGVGYQF